MFLCNLCPSLRMGQLQSRQNWNERSYDKILEQVLFYFLGGRDVDVAGDCVHNPSCIVLSLRH
jgi:hypothetical protein